MSDEAALLGEIFARPWDDRPRRSYGELLSERGDPRGELIRVQLEIFVDEASHQPGPQYDENLRREAELLAAHGEEWAAAIAPLVTEHTFRRGFVDAVKVDAAGYVERSAAIFAAAPVLHLDVRGLARHAEDVFASADLLRARTLLIYDNHLGDEGVELLAASPHVHELRYIDLMLNDVGRPGVEALCRSKGLPHLRYVKLTSNPVEDPRDRPVAVDNGVILEWEAHAIQSELEAAHGVISWLHYRTPQERYYPPEPWELIRP